MFVLFHLTHTCFVWTNFNHHLDWSFWVCAPVALSLGLQSLLLPTRAIPPPSIAFYVHVSLPIPTLKGNKRFHFNFHHKWSGVGLWKFFGTWESRVWSSSESPMGIEGLRANQKSRVQGQVKNWARVEGPGASWESGRRGSGSSRQVGSRGRSRRSGGSPESRRESKVRDELRVWGQVQRKSRVWLASDSQLPAHSDSRLPPPLPTRPRLPTRFAPNSRLSPPTFNCPQPSTLSRQHPHLSPSHLERTIASIATFPTLFFFLPAKDVQSSYTFVFVSSMYYARTHVHLLVGYTQALDNLMLEFFYMNKALIWEAHEKAFKWDYSWGFYLCKKLQFPFLRSFFFWLSPPPCAIALSLVVTCQRFKSFSILLLNMVE